MPSALPRTGRRRRWAGDGAGAGAWTSCRASGRPASSERSEPSFPPPGERAWRTCAGRRRVRRASAWQAGGLDRARSQREARRPKPLPYPCRRAGARRFAPWRERPVFARGDARAQVAGAVDEERPRYPALSRSHWPAWFRAQRADMAGCVTGAFATNQRDASRRPLRWRPARADERSTSVRSNEPG